MKAHTFSSIIEEIKGANSLTNKQRVRLLSLVSYIQSTKLELLRNITPKRIVEITRESDKNVIVDIFFFLCGTQWHLLEPIYRYVDEYSDEPIELTEEELADIEESGYIALDNGNIQSKFNPNLLYITFTLSELSIQLKKRGNT